MAEHIDFKLDNYRVTKLPKTVYYIPNFITEVEEKNLLNNVYSAPKPKWTLLSHRKLQNWGGLPHPKGMLPEQLPHWLEAYSKRVSALGVFEDKVPNHVLVNEYLPGQGIMPHEDGPLFYPTITTINLGSHTVLNYYRKSSSNVDLELSDSNEDLCDDGDNNEVMVISSPRNDRYFSSLFLERRSLLIVQDDMYTKYLHGIEEIVCDEITDSIANVDQCTGVAIGSRLERANRVSLTIRNVPNTLKTKFVLSKSSFRK